MRSDRKNILCILGISVTLFITGCGKASKAEAPELLEPAAVNDSYRPVEYGTIGCTKVLLGTAVPKDYCHYYNINVSVSKIYVEQGDFVNEGDIVASIDVEESKRQLDAAKEELSHENKSYELNEKISRAKIEEWEYLSQNVGQNDWQDNGQNDWQNDEQNDGQNDRQNYDKDISSEEENIDYDSRLHNYRVDKLNEKITELENVIENAVLKAEHSGQVTYIKNLAKDCMAGANENIVIISDINDIDIEIKGTKLCDYKYSGYDEKYIMAAGKRVDVKEKEYTSQEQMFCKVVMKYPNVHMECPAGTELEIGQTYPVYFTQTKAVNTLIIGNDSLYKTDDECFVYVRNPKGEKEKRNIAAGESDENYTEVKSGLDENELVYYSSTDRIPDNYEKYDIKLSDFSVDNHGLRIEASDSNVEIEQADYEGEIASMAVNEGDTVSKGDLLYVINTGEGKAAITEAKNAIDTENNNYRKIIDDYDKQIESMTEDENGNGQTDVVELQKQLAQIDHEYNLSKLQKQYDDISQNNDGDGNVSVYAKSDGTVSTINKKEGDRVEKKQEILKLKTDSTDVLVVKMVDAKETKVYTDNIADIGEKVQLTYSDKAYDGVCVGYAVSDDEISKGYVCNDETGVHVNGNSSSGYGQYAFYMKADMTQPKETSVDNDKAKLLKSAGVSADFSYISMNDVVVLPGKMICTEKNPMDTNKKKYFVWKVAGDNLVKQYILIDDNMPGNSKVVLSGLKDGDVIAYTK